MMKTLRVPGGKQTMYVVRLQTGAYFVRAEYSGPDTTTTDRAKATRFLVRDGEWNAEGWARRLLGTVEVA